MMNTPLRNLGLVPFFADAVFAEKPSFSRALRELGNYGALRTNITEQDDKFVITTEAPGISKENLSVKFDDDILTISTSYQKENEEKDGEKVIHRERFQSNQSRSFRFDNVDPESINASFENGVLSLTLLKKAKQNVKTIEIK